MSKEHSVEKNAVEQCRYMRAAYPTLTAQESCSEHRHDEQTFGLARALAAVVHECEPTDEQIGWFLDDAAAVVDDFDPAPPTWTLTKPEDAHGFGLDFALTINGVEYVVPESEWEPSHPVSRAEWYRWHDEAEDEATRDLPPGVGREDES